MSPIHDQGYRRYGGGREPQGRRWWVIGRAGLMARIRERRVIAVLLAAWLPFLVRAVQIYASANFQQVAFLAPTPQMFREFLDQQEVFIFIVSIVIGAGLIADDRRANALQIYLSKPLTRVEYIVGKLMTLAAVLAFVTWLPAMLLLVLQMLFAALAAYGCPHALVSDNGSVFTAKDYLAILRDLEIEPLPIEQGNPWQNLIEAQCKVPLRLADFQFEHAQS